MSVSTLANIIISVCVISSSYFLDENMSIMRPGYNPLVGYAILSIAILAMPFGVIKARSLSFKKKENITKSELFIITMLFFGALFTTILIVYMGCVLIEPRDFSFSDETLYIFGGVASFAVITFLLECWNLFLGSPKKEPKKGWVTISNLIVPLYCGISIAILWEGAFDPQWELDPIDLRKVIVSSTMAFLLILPFQRLFWYELFTDTVTGKESVKAVASIGLSWGIAVFTVL
ncbi:MAG: hypothetical protein COA33_010585 [Fluviicola sp.]|nr:hypothetical protein [Fluviicola sp.]